MDDDKVLGISEVLLRAIERDSRARRRLEGIPRAIVEAVVVEAVVALYDVPGNITVDAALETAWIECEMCHEFVVHQDGVFFEDGTDKMKLQGWVCSHCREKGLV
jgi:hypothetical protein